MLDPDCPAGGRLRLELERWVVLVQKLAAKAADRSALAGALAAPTKAVEPARARLEKYAFAHCQ